MIIIQCLQGFVRKVCESAPSCSEALKSLTEGAHQWNHGHLQRMMMNRIVHDGLQFP